MGSRRGRTLSMLVLTLSTACAVRRPTPQPALARAASSGDALAVSDQLETLIGAGADTPADRVFAYEFVRDAKGDDSAAFYYARAAVTGRFVQQRALLAAGLVRDIEQDAWASRTRDSTFRDGAATRLLGTLYVIAPATLLERGDSETGLQLLENLTESHPEVLENHLRLAEAYVSLGDPTPAREHLCRCLSMESRLGGDDRLLLRGLVADVGMLDCASGTAVIAAEPRPALPETGSTTPPAAR